MAQLTRVESPEISLAKLGRQTHEEITKYVKQNQRPSDSTVQEGMIGLTLDDTGSGQELLKLWLKQSQNKERLAWACGIEVKDLNLDNLKIGAFYLQRLTKSGLSEPASPNNTIVIIAAGDLGKENGMFRVADSEETPELESGQDLIISGDIGLYHSQGERGGAGLVLKVGYKYRLPRTWYISTDAQWHAGPNRSVVSSKNIGV